VLHTTNNCNYYCNYHCNYYYHYSRLGSQFVSRELMLQQDRLRFCQRGSCYSRIGLDFVKGAHATAGGSNRSRGLRPLPPLTLSIDKYKVT